MDEIESLQSKHINITIPQLKDIIKECGKQVQQVREKENQLIKENEVQLEELVSKVIVLKEDLHTEQQVLEQKNKELLKYNDNVERLIVEHDKLIQENQNLEIQKNIIKTTKPNQQDQLLLEQGRAKLHLYKALTGINWDYSTLKDSIKGYVSNKHDYIHHFCFTKNEVDPEELSDLLWNEIYLSVENMLNENIKEDSIVKN